MRHISVVVLFFIYRSLWKLGCPFIFLYLLWRFIRGKEEGKRCKERLGYTKLSRPSGALIWFHAVSVGETIAIIPIIERISQLPIHTLLTTSTVTSARLVEEHLKRQVFHQYAPFDSYAAVCRFLDYWKPNLVFVCESEIWPIRIDMLNKRKIPQILLNARISDRSYKKWKFFIFLAREFFSKFTIILCQSETDKKYFKNLGAKRIEVCGNLKADVVLPENFLELKQYRTSIGNRPCWAAISTHEGEELIAVRVHTLLRKYHPKLLTIIVPRHLDRIPAIIKCLRKYHYTFIQKSSGQFPDERTNIFLGDTVGDMGLYLRLTEIAFIGKSLSVDGGHNPLEPALTGTAILSGRKIKNFQEIYQEFIKNKAALLVDDATMLASCINHLLEDPIARKKMIYYGYQTASKMGGAAKRSLEILEPFFQSISLSVQLKEIKR